MRKVFYTWSIREQMDMYMWKNCHTEERKGLDKFMEPHHCPSPRLLKHGKPEHTYRLRIITSGECVWMDRLDHRLLLSFQFCRK